MGLAETREPGVPEGTAWRPFTRFLITFIHVKNAMNVILGQSVANGHDYRASLARFTSPAHHLPGLAASTGAVQSGVGGPLSRITGAVVPH